MRKTFLVANTSAKVIFKMLFLVLNKVDTKFEEQKYISRSYHATNALFITKQMIIVYRKIFIAAALILEKKTFVVHMAFFNTK